MSASGAGNGSPRGDGGLPQLDKPGRGFPRRLRITASALFREAFDQDRRFPGRYMVMWVRSGQGAELRLGVVAGRRSFRRAVDRARAKRLLREAYRLHRGELRGEVDVVLLARPAILAVKRPAVDKDFLILARKAGIRRSGGQRKKEKDRD